jgi:hypothetical protein
MQRSQKTTQKEEEMTANKRSWWPLVVPLVVAPIAAHGAPDRCSKVKAISGDLTVAEASIVNGVRIPTVVTLNGSNSNPKNNCTCTWTQSSGPAVQLSDPSSCTTTFTAPDVGTSGQNLDFRLTVKSTEAGCETLPADSKGITVAVTNMNHPPVASVSTAASVYEGAKVTLDGSASSDPDGDLLDFVWSQTGGTPVTLTTDSTGKMATFTAPPENYPDGETLKFQLKVSDGNLSNSTPDVLISVASVNEAPVAAISCPTAVNEAAPVTLSGNNSSDPDAGPLAYQWSQDQGGPVANLDDVILGASAITFKAPTLTSPSYDTMKFGLTVTDNGKVSSSAHCDIKVSDVTPPVISGISDILNEATSPSGAAVTFAPVAHDAFYGDVPVQCDPHSGSVFALGTRSVVCTASDQATAPNTAKATFEVTVQDTTPPVVTVPPDTQAEATGPSGALVTFSPSALDVVDGSVTPSCSPASGTSFALGTTTVTCSAADKTGNKGSSSFAVSVADTTPPAVTVPSDLKAEATGPSGALVTFSASAVDVVDGSVTPSCSPVSGTSFALGTTTVTCSATDKTGNKGGSSFGVTVADSTPPVVTAPATVSVYATGLFTPVTLEYPTATDTVDGVVPLVSNAPTAGFAVGATTVTWTARDKAGNVGTASSTVTVKPWTLSGFYSPIDMNGIVNTVKAGSTVPLKFQVFSGGNELSTTSSISSIKASQVGCSMTASEDAVPVEFLVTGGTSLRYDTTGRHFIFNWQTPKLPGTCYVVTATTLEGSTMKASFKLK